MHGLCMDIHVLHSHNLWVLFQLAKDLISQWIGDLGIYARVPDIPVSQMISNILDTAPGFKPAYGDRKCITVQPNSSIHTLALCGADKPASRYQPQQPAP
jgi:hypothetical protein